MMRATMTAILIGSLFGMLLPGCGGFDGDAEVPVDFGSPNVNVTVEGPQITVEGDEISQNTVTDTVTSAENDASLTQEQETDVDQESEQTQNAEQEVDVNASNTECARSSDCKNGEYCLDGECVECISYADCDDGFFCNGEESCRNGQCRFGIAPCDYDEVCNETTEECQTEAECDTDSDCDDGIFCNGGETCEDGDCVDGESPCNEDETCNESAVECVDDVEPGHCDPDVILYANDFEDDGTWPEWGMHLNKQGETPSGRKFMGPFARETDCVTLTLNDLPKHTNISVAFDLFIIDSYDGNAPYYPQYGPDYWGLMHSDTMESLLWTTFSNCPDRNPQAYPDEYPGGDFPCLTGASEIDTLGYGEYGDSVYSFPNSDHDFTFSHDGETLLLHFCGSPNQAWPDEGWGIDNLVIRLSNAEDCTEN